MDLDRVIKIAEEIRLIKAVAPIMRLNGNEEILKGV